MNLRTANALRLTIPPSLLARADEVIELGLGNPLDLVQGLGSESCSGKPHDASLLQYPGRLGKLAYDFRSGRLLR